MQDGQHLYPAENPSESISQIMADIRLVSMAFSLISTVIPSSSETGTMKTSYKTVNNADIQAVLPVLTHTSWSTFVFHTFIHRDGLM